MQTRGVLKGRIPARGRATMGSDTRRGRGSGVGVQVDKLKGGEACGPRTGSDRWGGPQVPDLVSSAQASLCPSSSSPSSAWRPQPPRVAAPRPPRGRLPPSSLRVRASNPSIVAARVGRRVTRAGDAGGVGRGPLLAGKGQGKGHSWNLLPLDRHGAEGASAPSEGRMALWRV